MRTVKKTGPLPPSLCTAYLKSGMRVKVACIVRAWCMASPVQLCRFRELLARSYRAFSMCIQGFVVARLIKWFS